MQTTEKQMILDYLQIEDTEDMPLADLIYLLIENSNEAAMEYEILASAYESSVPVENFETFREEVVESFSKLEEGDEMAEEILEKIAAKYV